MADYTYPVIDNHPANSANYCPMCGGEIDGQGDATVQPVAEWEIALRMARMMARLNLYFPMHMRVLSHKVLNPEHTLRQTADGIGLGRSRVSEIIADLERDFPGMGVLLGATSKAALSQRKRRAGASIPAH